MVVRDAPSAANKLWPDIARKASNMGIVTEFSFSDALPEDGKTLSVYLHHRQCSMKQSFGKTVSSSVSRQSSDSVLVITNCLERLEEELMSVDTPHSVFASSQILLNQKKILRIMTVRGKAEIKKCMVNFGKQVTPPPACFHDAMGSELKALTLEYTPFVKVQEWPNSTLKPEITGYTVDLWTNLGRLGNFTYKLSKDPSGIWGAFPSSNSAQNNVTLVGLIGRLLRNEVDVPMSVWPHTINRQQWSDFTYSTKNAEYRCFTDKEILRRHDLYFQKHPFTLVSWLVILAASIVCILLTMLFQNLGYETSSRIVSFIGNFIFTLVSAFYGGALIMFLAISKDPPFSNILEVAGSDLWKLKLSKGEENVLRNYFDMCDPRVEAAVKKYTSQEYLDTQASTYEETVITLSNVPYSVMFTSADRIATALAYLEERTVKMNLHKFCDPLKVQVSGEKT